MTQSKAPKTAVSLARSQPFARCLPMQLMRAREALMQQFRPHLHEHEITDQQWRIIRALAESDALEIGDLGKRCCIHPASLSRILPKLDAAGVTGRRSNDGDKRRVMISLTAQGRRLFSGIAPESEEIQAAITRRLGAKRLQEIHRMLEELIQALQAGKDAPSSPGRARKR